MLGCAKVWPATELAESSFFGWFVREGRPKFNKLLEYLEREPNAIRVYDEVWDSVVLLWKVTDGTNLAWRRLSIPQP